MTDQPQPPNHPVEDLPTAERSWWQRFSSHGELPWSGAVSVVAHGFVILVIIMLVAPLVKRDPTPPAVDVITVGEEDSAAAGNDPLLPEGGILAAAASQAALPTLPADAANAAVEQITESQTWEPEFTPDNFSNDAATAAVAAQSALDGLRSRMATNISGGGTGSQVPGAGGGGGGTGSTGRAARQARWVLHFNTMSPSDYLAQLDGLGAAIAFPLRDNKWRYFEKDGSGRKTYIVDNLDSESRLYWLDEGSQSFPETARLLGVPSAPFMTVFLPAAVEQRMLKLELAYNNLEESEIATTHFKTVRRGGKLDVIVTEQIAR